MRSLKYMIIECYGPRHLEEAVSHYLDRGWTALGNPVIYQKRKFLGLFAPSIWCQAMTLGITHDRKNKTVRAPDLE